MPQPPTAPSCTQHLHPSTPAKQQRLHYYDSAGVELEVLDGINVITVRHLDRLDGGELLARGPRLDWAKLLRRSFSVDVLACPRCGGRLRPIADITEQASIQRLVDHLAAPPAPPTPRARAPTALHHSLH